jgi:hypothetical protein
MGRYETEAQTLDALVCALPYFLPFWAAGNEQDPLTTLGGFQSITFSSLAKKIGDRGCCERRCGGRRALAISWHHDLLLELGALR